MPQSELVPVLEEEGWVPWFQRLRKRDDRLAKRFSIWVRVKIVLFCLLATYRCYVQIRANSSFDIKTDSSRINLN